MTNRSSPTAAKSQRLLIVLINWHEEAQTLQCLERLRNQNVPGTELLVIDNEGNADSRAGLHARAGLFDHYHRYDENVGFTGACNFGLSYAKEHGFPYVLWFNNDAIPQDGCLTELLALIESDPRIAMVSPVLRDTKTNEVHFCGAVLDSSVPAMRYLNFADLMGSTPPTDCYLYGTALMSRTDVACAVGGFPSGYFIYWEDMELSRKVIAAGYQCRVVPTAFVDHDNQHSDELSTVRSRYYYYYMARNEFDFWKHSLSGLPRLRALYWHWWRVRERIRRLNAGGHEAETTALRHGLKDGVLGRLGRWRLHPAKRIPA